MFKRIGDYDFSSKKPKCSIETVFHELFAPEIYTVKGGLRCHVHIDVAKRRVVGLLDDNNMHFVHRDELKAYTLPGCHFVEISIHYDVVRECDNPVYTLMDLMLPRIIMICTCEASILEDDKDEPCDVHLIKRVEELIEKKTKMLPRCVEANYEMSNGETDIHVPVLKHLENVSETFFKYSTETFWCYSRIRVEKGTTRVSQGEMKTNVDNIPYACVQLANAGKKNALCIEQENTGEMFCCCKSAPKPLASVIDTSDTCEYFVFDNCSVGQVV
ncbi:hypothetical protein AB6A40_008153 [Gnathostoma spinigerum]|uniref:Uncharacterized protein n=1 Tax=Gnathostoma spinigerum TaxID=75299 RepID=A0ABD6ETE4_9BILA